MYIQKYSITDIIFVNNNNNVNSIQYYYKCKPIEYSCKL